MPAQAPSCCHAAASPYSSANFLRYSILALADCCPSASAFRPLTSVSVFFSERPPRHTEPMAETVNLFCGMQTFSPRCTRSSSGQSTAVRALRRANCAGQVGHSFILMHRFLLSHYYCGAYSVPRRFILQRSSALGCSRWQQSRSNSAPFGLYCSRARAPIRPSFT